MHLKPGRTIRFPSAANMEEAALLTCVNMREMAVLLLDTAGVCLRCLAVLVWNFAGRTIETLHYRSPAR